MPSRRQSKTASARVGRKTAIAVALVVAMLAVGGGVAYLVLSSGDGSEGAFVYYMADPIVSLDPADAADRGSRVPIENIYDTLVRQKGNAPEEFSACLATAWTVSENGLWYNFTLREGVKFSNGNGFNASDVKFTIERVIKMDSPDTGTSALISGCVDLEGTRVTSDVSITIRLTRPTPAFLSYVSQSFPMGIVDREHVLSQYAPDDLYAHEFMREHPMGTGPFKLLSLSPGKELTLVDYRDHWRGWDGEHVDKVVLRYEPDAERRSDALSEGRADAVELPAGFRGEVLEIEGASWVSFPSTHIEIVAMNSKSGTKSQPFMRNAGVRSALAFSFDYANVSSGVYLGTMTSLSGCIPDSVPFAAEAQPSKSFSFNLTMASELLNSSGYGLDVRDHRFNGTTVRLFFEPGDALRALAADSYASTLRRLGMLVTVEENDQLGPVVNRAWDLYIASLEAWYQDPEYFVTALALSEKRGGDGFMTGIDDSVIDDASIRATTALTRSSRISNFTTVWQELSVEPNMVYVGQLPVTLAVRNNVDWLYVHPLTSLDLYSVREL